MLRSSLSYAHFTPTSGFHELCRAAYVGDLADVICVEVKLDERKQSAISRDFRFD